MASKAQSRATNKYNKKTYKQYAFRLNLENDADVIRVLDAQENKADFIRQLIRKECSKMQ